MKKAAMLAALLVALSTPAFAARNDDSAPGRTNPINRIVQIVKRLLAGMLDDGDVKGQIPLP